MSLNKGNFTRVLSREATTEIPLYCTGYPEMDFIDNYIKKYNLRIKNDNRLLNNKNYNIIKQMGFDAISLWDFRRGEGGFDLDQHKRVDGWGRIYYGDWYSWEGIFKNEKTISEWKHLILPSNEKFSKLKEFLKKSDIELEYVISLPGLFEKTWQSMGFYHFAKSIKKNQKLIEIVIDFFFNYLNKLIIKLQKYGAKIFLIADDYGYKNRTFIPKETWIEFFFNKYNVIIDLIHKRKDYIILHSDGYISDMMDIFVDLGFDAIQSLESNAGVNIFSLFKKFKNRIGFIGNLDISLLSFGIPLQVKSYVVKLIENARKNNCSLAVSPTQQINSKCQVENINAMIETTKIFK
ncbi:MAG: uroporphyrinogen decarboxylase family protein [Promethearchaeota archaeon]